MSIEAINGCPEFENVDKAPATSSTWNERSVQHNKKDLLVQPLALMHMATQKQNGEAICKLEREICVLRDVIEKEDDYGFGNDKLLNFDFGKLFKLMNEPRDACLKLPHFLQTEERVRFLLNIPTSLPKKGATENPLNSSIIALDPDAPIRIYSDSSPPSESSTFEILGIKLARGRIGGINGIGNNIDDAKAHAHYLQSLSSNYHVEWTHNCSHSVPVDALEVPLLNYQGFSAPAKLLKNNWAQFHETHKNDSGAKYLQFCHSQGALHVRNALASAPEEIRNRVIVVAISPGTVVAKDLCFASFNYASRRDPIPVGEAAWQTGWDAPPIHTISEIVKTAFKELILLEPHQEANAIDHEFQSPTFREVIKRHLDQYIEQYGLEK